ncbi:MAG TPA: hypothetical protein VJO53_11965 [Candidatus Acidoferrales bacterium]|nr:hypothetical protein [Candidatus Acidoferrales bacterium]
MIGTIDSTLHIEDLGNHPEETVLTLRELLAGGAKITPDPKRSGFYEVENGAVTYYIHVSPVKGTILLIATWTNRGVPPGAGAAA